MSTPQKKRKTNRTVIESQARSIIAKVYDFMKKEARENHAERITDAVWRTARASGTSEATVKRILKERRTQPSPTKFASPMQNRIVKDRKTLDDFAIGVVHKTIQNYHITHNKFPPLKKLKDILQEEVGFDGCVNTLRKILMKLGYKWRRPENNKKKLTVTSKPHAKRDDYGITPSVSSGETYIQL